MVEAIVEYGPFFFAGAVGGFVRQLVVGKGNIVLWSFWKDKETGKKGIDLGIVASLFIGGVVGVIVDQSFFTAFTWGLTGSYILEELVKREMSKSKDSED